MRGVIKGHIVKLYLEDSIQIRESLSIVVVDQSKLITSICCTYIHASLIGKVD